MLRYIFAAIRTTSTDREISTYFVLLQNGNVVLKSLIKSQSNHTLMTRESGHFGEVSCPVWMGNHLKGG